MDEELRTDWSEEIDEDNYIETKRRKPKPLFTGALAVCAILIVVLIINGITHGDYSVRFSDTNEYVLAYNYYHYDGEILKVASDSAAYINEENEIYWSTAYDMTEPKAIFQGSALAIYDLNGTSFVTGNKKGPGVSVTTTMPIIKASVSAEGNVAVITDDGTNAWVEYYDKNGSKISSIKTTMDATGYPFDLAVSPDGTVLAVSYITYEDSQMTSRIRFYDFTVGGSDRQDNIVSTYAYTGILIPQIEYIDNNVCAAFADDGVYLFKGSRKPEQYKHIAADGNIISTFFGNKYFGFIVNDSTTGENNMYVYGPSGFKKGSTETRIAYTAIATGKNDIVLYNRNQIAIYSLNGSKKLECTADVLIREMAPVGNGRYIMIAEEEYRLISLA